MERYSTLYGAHTFVNADGKEVNQYIEIGRSAGLDEFLKSKKIPNPTMAVSDVNNTLTGFVKLPGYDEQPKDIRPMLVRYAPMHLKRLTTYENVLSFNAIACSAPDHQVGNRDGKYSNTHFIDRNLLLKVGEYNYLDQIFGTHLVTWMENRDVRTCPIDYDRAPQKVQIPQFSADAMVVQMVAAALINKAAVVLKLEHGATFQTRSMALLKQIYGLFAPIQAAEIGFSSYEDPKRINDLIATTTIRLFVVPAEADLGNLGNQPNMLILDLNKEITKPKGNDLLRAVSIWYATPWENRASTMAVLFADLYDPNDARSYVERTRKYKDASDAVEKKLAENRGKIASFEELKKLYDSFGVLMSIPCQYEKFCRIAPRLMRLSGEAAEKGRSSREQRSQWIKDEMTRLGTEAVMEKGENPELTTKERLYDFCCDVFKANFALELSSKVKNRSEEVTRDCVTKKMNERFENERNAIAVERAGFEEQKTQAVNAEKAKTEAVKTAMENQRIELLKEKEAAVNAEKAKTDAAEKAMENQRIELLKEKENAVNAEKAKTDAVEKAMEAQRTGFQEQLTNAVNAEKAKTDAVKKEMEAQRDGFQEQLTNAVNAEKTETDRVRGLLTQAEENWNQINEELTKSKNRVEKLKTQNEKQKRDIEDKAKEIEDLNTEVEKQKKNVENARAGHIPMDKLFGQSYPAMAKPLIQKISAIALAAGLILGMLTGGIIGSCSKGPEPIEPKPVVTDPVVTDPIVTDPIVTDPIVTDPIVSEPVVDDVVDTAPTSIFNDDGTIAWDYAYGTMIDIQKIAHESADMETLLAELDLTAEGYPRDLEAVITVVGTDAENPAFLAVSKAGDQEQGNDNTDETSKTEDEENIGNTDTTDNAETDTAVTALSELVPSMILDNGIYHIEVFYTLDDGMLEVRDRAIKVAQQLLREFAADEDEVTITTVVKKEITVDLHNLMSKVSGNQLWWKDEYRFELREAQCGEKKESLGTSRTPILLVVFSDGSDAVIYDYADATNKRSAMVDVLEKHGYKGAYNDTLVIGLNATEQEVTGGTTDEVTEG